MNINRNAGEYNYKEADEQGFNAKIKQAVGDGTAINIGQLRDLELKHPDLYKGFLISQVEIMGKQIEDAVKNGMDVDAELAARNWLADYFTALGAVVKRMTREEIVKQREDKRGQTEAENSKKYIINEINQRAGDIEAAEALDIMNQVYRSGGVIPGKLATIHRSQEIGAEDLSLVRKWLSMPGLGKDLHID